METLLRSRMQFAYSQFIVNDVAEPYTPIWTQQHSDQGFVRSEAHVAFRTLTEFGDADLQVFSGPFPSAHSYELAIEVPFSVLTGSVAIEGPEEVLLVDRKIALPVGPYRLVAAQRLISSGDDDPEDEDAEPEIAVDCYFERLSAPLDRSRILISHPILAPPPQLSEAVEPQK